MAQIATPDEFEKKEQYDSEQPPYLEEGEQAPKRGIKRFLGSEQHETVRGMSSRHLTFIAIGGTIGTGIFLSAGTSVATAGAGGALIAYSIVGLFVLGVVMCVGEMSSLIPVSGAFSTFGDRFVSPALGATLGFNYFLQWAFSIPSELTAAGIVLSYWTDKLQTYQWAIIIIVPVFLVQCINVRAYGETEYWLALIKVILIVLFIIVGLLYDWGAVKGHPGPGLSNFNDGPFFGGFPGLVQSFTYAFYSYGGTELVALAAGESAKPHKSVPRAIRSTWIRIVLFYILTILVIGLCINHNDERLFSAYDNSDVAASPITVVFVNAGFGAAASVVNAVILSAILSATNSCFFASSRMLRSLAKQGQAPRIFGWTTKRGVPIPALLLTLAMSCLVFLTTIWGSGVVFTWFISVTGMSALMTWISIAVIHIRFRRAYKAQGRDLADLPFKAPFSPFLPLLTIVLGACMFAAQGWAATTYDDGKVAIDLVAVYIGLVLFIGIGLFFAIHHKMTKTTPLIVPLLECDFESDAVWGRGGAAIAKEEERKEKELAKADGRLKWYSYARWKDSIY